MDYSLRSLFVEERDGSLTLFQEKVMLTETMNEPSEPEKDSKWRENLVELRGTSTYYHW